MSLVYIDGLFLLLRRNVWKFSSVISLRPESSALTELEMNNIPILHSLSNRQHILTSVSGFSYISLPLLTILPSGFDGPHALRTLAQIVEVLVSHDFGFDETAFEITVDGSSGLGGKTTSWNRPASDFLLACCEVILQSQFCESFSCISILAIFNVEKIA